MRWANEGMTRPVAFMLVQNDTTKESRKVASHKSPATAQMMERHAVWSNDPSKEKSPMACIEESLRSSHPSNENIKRSTDPAC